MIKHIPGTMYPVGTRYSNSMIYDEATDEILFGFQVFRQCNPDGTPTGRKSFVDNNGSLCSLEIAEDKRSDAVRKSAPDLLKALLLARQKLDDEGYFPTPEIDAAIAKAKGIAA